MTKDSKLWDICFDIYQEMYRKAEPKANFRKLMKDGVTIQKDWFQWYHLSMNEQQKIFDKHIKKHKLSKYDRIRISKTVWLGCGPCSCEGLNHDM